MSDIKKREIRWGRSFKNYYSPPESKAFELLMSEAIKHRYLRFAFNGFGHQEVNKTIKLDRFCRDVLDAELIIGESTGQINGIRFRNQEDCIHFKMRVD